MSDKTKKQNKTPGSRRICQYEGCRNVEKFCPGKRFYCLPNPRKRPLVFHQWLVNSGNLSNAESFSRNYLHKRLCSDHFRDTDLIPQSRRLKRYAVPINVFGTNDDVPNKALCTEEGLFGEEPIGDVETETCKVDIDSEGVEAENLFETVDVAPQKVKNYSRNRKVSISNISQPSGREQQRKTLISCTPPTLHAVGGSAKNTVTIGERYKLLIYSDGKQVFTRDDGDDGAQTDVNSLHSNTNKAQTATKKVESQEAAGPSNIESQQCDSSGNVQSESIEASPLLYVDTTFGILEESGMGQFLPTPSVDESSSQSQVDTEEITNKDKEKEAQEKHNASSMATLISPTCTRVPIDAPTFKLGNVTQARNYTRDKEKNSSKAKVDTDHRAKVDTNHRAKFDQMINAVMSQKKLDSVINKLESLSKTFAVAAENDKYENFGKYISSLLRGLPNRKVISLKKKMISQVMEALTEENKQRGINSIGIQVDANDIEPPMLFASLGDRNVNELQKTVKNICFQVDSKKSSRKAPIGLSRAGKCGVSAAAKSLVTNKNRMLGGTLPILFPGASTSNSSFKLLPVMPVSSPAVGSGATVLTSTSSLVAPLQPLPISSGETITTVAKSADGTLIAVTIPKPTEMQQLQVLGPRCQKRKQPTHTAAYLIKKSCPFPPSPQTSCSLPMSPMSHTVVASNSSSCQSSTSQLVRVSQTLSHVENRNNEEVQEFDMDIEDGNELKPIPGCKEYFETVICGEDSVMYIKEEEPDVYENPTTPADNSPIAYNQEEEPDPNTNPTTPADNSPIASAQEEEPDPNTNPTTQVDNSLTTYAQEEEPDPNTNLSTAVDNSPTVFAQEEEPDPNTTPTTAVDNSSIAYAQEEEPDPNTNPTTAAGLPHTATTSIICSLCDVSCENKDELNRHYSTVHPGCIPAESSGDRHHVL